MKTCASLSSTALERRPFAFGDLDGAAIGHQRAVVERGVAAERLAGAGRGMAQQIVRAEIVGEAFALVLRRRVQQPHQQEERHHRRHEVGVGHLPGAAMMTAAFDDLDSS